MIASDRPPFLLIRVQDALHGAELREGGLYLPYRRDGVHGAHRNTSHWAVNALVSDHAYGSFSRATDGSLKGSVVIVADPRELPTPAGLGEVDTWFRLDATVGPDGALERGLSVGRRAVVIAPEGLDVPEGVSVVRYDGTIEQRDAAVEAVARAYGVRLEQAGMWGWVGTGTGGRPTGWANAMATTHYPQALAAGTVHLGSHSSSPDEAIEAGARVDAMLERFATERLHERDDGSQVSLGDELRRLTRLQRGVLHATLDAMPEDERARVGAFYDERLQALDRADARTDALDHVWQDRLAEMVEPAGPAEAAARTGALPPPLPRPTPAPWAMNPPPLPGRGPSPASSTGVPPPLPEQRSNGWTPSALTGARLDTWHDRTKIGGTAPLPTSRPVKPR